MINVQVDSLTFTFPPSWEAYKYDESAFYRNQFSKMWSGIKAVDLIAIEGQEIWLIEAKDYRQQTRTKPIDLADEVEKRFSVRSPLCCLPKLMRQIFLRRNMPHK